MRDAVTLALGYDGFVVGVRCADPAPVAWLREFTAGPFAESAGAPDATVALVLAPERYASLAALPGPARDVECFTQDGGFRLLPGREADDGALVMHDADGRVVQVVRVRAIEVVAEADHLKSRTTLLRVVRELATGAALRAGQLPVHGAAVATGRGVVAFVGPRRSGKTSLLLHALQHGARYVTNDRLFVDAAPVARGMPTLVTVRAGTLERLGLAEHLRARRYDRAWTLAEIARGDTPPPDRFPPSLTPAQLCALVGADATGAGPLAALVFPRLDPAPGFDLRPLPPAEAAAALADGLLLAAPTARAAAAYGPTAGAADQRTLAARCAELATQVECFELRLGPDAYERRVWRTIAQTLPEPIPDPSGELVRAAIRRP